MVVSSNALTVLDLRSLREVGSGFAVSEARALTTLHVSVLQQVNGFIFDEPDLFEDSIWINHTALDTIDLGALSTTEGGIVTGDLTAPGNPELRTVLLSSLTHATFVAFTEPALETVSVPIIATLDRININDSHSIRTLDFGNLQHVTTWLMLDHTSLADLTGFRSLQTVRALSIVADDRLRDLSGLSSVQQLSSLTLQQNTALTSLDGLEGVTQVSGHVEVSFSNAALTSVAGLRNVTSIGGALLLNIAPLASIELTSLRTVGGNLSLARLPSVTSLSGLGALTSVGGDLGIVGLPSLTSLSGLNALTSVAGRVSFSEIPLVPPDDIDSLLRRLGKR